MGTKKKDRRAFVPGRMPDTARYNVYDPFAEIYDQHWGTMFSDDARRGLRAVVLPQLKPKAKILDLCCGTGQLAHWLSGCGFRVTGLDGSSEMIRLARKNAPQAEFVVDDARTFDLPNSFDAVMSMFDSLNHIPTGQGLLEVFQRVHRALKKNGLFFFDLNMDEGFRNSRNEMYSGVDPDRVFVTSAEYFPKSQMGKTLVTLFHAENGAWVRRDLEIVEYCYEEAAVKEWLAQAGFNAVVAYEAKGDFGITGGEGRLFFLAAKEKLPQRVVMRP